MTTQANRAGVAKLWLLNFVANAVALAAWYFWLLVPDAHGWQVAGSLLAAVCIIVMVVWLRAGTLAYFRVAAFRDSGAVWRAFRHSLRHLVALALWAVVLAVVLWFLVLVAHLSAAIRGLAVAEVAGILALRQPAPAYALCLLAAVAPDARSRGEMAARRDHDCRLRGSVSRRCAPGAC